MTGKIDAHNLRFGRDRGKLTGKLGTRIPRVAVGRTPLQIHRFLDQLCPPCRSMAVEILLALQFFPKCSSLRSRGS